MNLDIATLGYVGNNFKEDKKGQVDLSLDEYQKIARYLVISMRSEFGYQASNEILSNDDAMANITTQIMLSDWNFDGRGSKEGYRKSMARYAVCGYLTRRKRAYKKQVKSLHTLMGSGEDSQELLSIIADPDEDSTKTAKDVENKEFVEFLLSDDKLTDKQHSCAYNYYIENRTLQDIACEKGVTREAVRLSIKKAKEKMKGLAAYVGVDS